MAMNISNGFVNHGYEVDLVLVNETGGLLSELDENVRTIDLQSSRVLSSIPPYRRYLRDHQPGVIISIGMHVNIVAGLAKTTVGFSPTHIITEHSILKRMDSCVKKTAMKHLAKRIYPRADAIVAVSEGVKTDLRNLVGYRGNVDVIYNPIVSDQLLSDAKEDVDHPWFTEDAPPVVLSVGRLAPEKSLKTLIDAFALIDRQPQPRLVIIGDGPQKVELETYVSERGIEETVTFLGFVENPYNYMANADIFVLSSENEGFGMVLVEALACGCPVVSTDCPYGPSEILADGKYGQLVPVSDEKTMSEAIMSTLHDPIDETILKSRGNEFRVNKSFMKYEELIERTED
jgi:glycosyltransferase involved in cell wall biosynthesis